MNFKETGEHRLDAFSESWINEDFALLYDVITSKNWVITVNMIHLIWMQF